MYWVKSEIGLLIDERNIETMAEPDKKVTYYSISIPLEDTKVTNDQPVVVTNLKDLQPLLKRNAHARFRSFSTYEDAVDFMRSPDKAVIGTPVKTQPLKKGRASLPNTIVSFEKRAVVEEKPNNFPTPRPQQLSLMNSYIVRHLQMELKKEINSNPRLLCTDCDVAPAVHEGTKLNALHAAAKCNNFEAAEMVLTKISELEFFEALYPSDPPEIRRERCRHLTTSYLNTPDRLLLESPLHYAAKFCSVDVLKLLVKHPLCNLNSKNDQGFTPLEIAGSRFNGPKSEALKKEVVALLKKNYIISIWRDDLTNSPLVGTYAKWRSFGNKLPKSFYSPFSRLPDDLLQACDETLIPRSRYGEVYQISAYAGPTTKKEAEALFQCLKDTAGRRIVECPTSPMSPCSPLSPVSPPSRGRTPLSPFSSPTGVHGSFGSPPPLSSKDLALPCTPTKSISKESRANMTLRMEDSVKGLERVCRKYANSLNIPWTEYWKFLDEYCNLETPEGLALLESYLLAKEAYYAEEEMKEENTLNQSMLSFDNSNSFHGRGFSYSMCMREENGPLDVINGSLTQTLCDVSSDSIDALNDKLQSLKIIETSSPELSVGQLSPTVCTKNFENDEEEFQPIGFSSPAAEKPGYDAAPHREGRNVTLSFNEMCWGYRDLANTSFNSDISDHDHDDSAELSYEEGNEALTVHLFSRLRDENDDELSFTTAMSHDEEVDDFEDCDSWPIFLDGREPKENDRQAYLAVKYVMTDELMEKFPAVCRWYNAMKAGLYVRSRRNSM